MTDLTIINMALRKKEKNKQHQERSLYDRPSMLLIIPHLLHLIITNSHKVGTTDKDTEHKEVK